MRHQNGSRALHLKLISLLLLIYCIFLPGSSAITEETLLKLKAQFLENPLQKWIHRHQFTALEDLFITYPLLNHSIHFPHQISNRMKNVFHRAMNGEPVNMAILGGSISAGATLYKENNENKIYFYALQDWWNNVIKPITGSEMYISNYAIGATGSDFYAYCLENFIRENTTDIVMWELSANDYHRFDNRDVPPTLPLEILTRNILRLKSQPALIYAHFFRGKDYQKEGDCNNLEWDGANYMSKYYRIPSVSWRKLVCRNLVRNEKTMFGRIFARDSSHPSLLGHAQMGFLTIHLFRKLFSQVVDRFLSPTTGTSLTTIAGMEQAIERSSMGINALPSILPLLHVGELPRTVYLKTGLVSDAPICFTFNVPSQGTMPFNRKKVLRVVRNDGYIISIAHGFLVRQDKTRGLRTREPNRELHLEINVPQQTTPGLNDWMILIGSYSNFGGAIFFLDTKFSRVIETEKYAYGSIIAAVATHVLPGKHTLVIKSLRKGFFLSSVMLG